MPCPSNVSFAVPVIALLMKGSKRKVCLLIFVIPLPETLVNLVFSARSDDFLQQQTAIFIFNKAAIWHQSNIASVQFCKIWY